MRNSGSHIDPIHLLPHAGAAVAALPSLLSTQWGLQQAVDLINTRLPGGQSKQHKIPRTYAAALIMWRTPVVQLCTERGSRGVRHMQDSTTQQVMSLHSSWPAPLVVAQARGWQVTRMWH